MRVPKLLLLVRQIFKDSIRNNILHTKEAGVGVVRVVDGALEEVLVEAGAVVVSLDLARHVVAVDGEGADMLAELFHGFEGLKHHGALV